MKKYTAKALLPDASERNDEAYKLGCRLFKQRKYKKAIAVFEEALRYWPKDAQAWMAIGNCYDELRKPLNAEKCFGRALDYCRAKDRDGIQFNLGNSLLDQERYGAAVKHYDEISKTSGLFVKAQKNKGIAQERMKDLRGGASK